MREDESEEPEVARPPAPHEQVFDSRIEEDLGYEIEDEYVKEKIADYVYNPKPVAEFGFDATVEGARTSASGGAPLAAPAAYASNTGAFAEGDEKAAPAAPTNLVASSKGYVMPKNMAEAPEETDEAIDEKFGLGAQEVEDDGFIPGQQLDTVDEGDSENDGGDNRATRGAGKQNRIRVAVKFRPITKDEMVSKSFKKQKEADPEQFMAWETGDGGDLDVLIQKGVRSKVEGKNMFHVDRVYEVDDDTEAVYSDICEPIVDAVVSGRHGTIFGYGATGGGKSHTIQGGKGEMGMIQLAAKDLFDRISEDQSREYTVKASYIEIYNEQVRDLMGQDEDDNPKSRRATAVISTVNKINIALPILTIREDSKGGDTFVDASFTKVSNLENIIRVLHKGNRNRATEKTKTNKFSSRSHAIFRLTVESHEIMEDKENIEKSEGIKLRVAALNFVDLAGSENSTKSSTAGIRKREGGKINQRYVFKAVRCDL